VNLSFMRKAETAADGLLDLIQKRRFDRSVLMKALQHWADQIGQPHESPAQRFNLAYGCDDKNRMPRGTEILAAFNKLGTQPPPSASASPPRSQGFRFSPQTGDHMAQCEGASCIPMTRRVGLMLSRHSIMPSCSTMLSRRSSGSAAEPKATRSTSPCAIQLRDRTMRLRYGSRGPRTRPADKGQARPTFSEHC
jgi:hypothetical protein